MFETLHQVATEHDIFIEKIGKLVFGIPLGFPTADNAKTKTIGMTLVTHVNSPCLRRRRLSGRAAFQYGKHGPGNAGECAS